ncbi:MAG: polysaccharide deacetylase family protein [Clostridia bacterium]|nr:polysaccharide deacetylase family protein [Clostridia bacterium]
MEFSISKYYGGKAGAFSLSFDDGCYKESTLEVADILRDINKRYSLNMKFTSAQTVNFLHEGLIDMWRALLKEGICDIASHGIDHMVGMNEETPLKKRYNDAKSSKEALEKIYGTRIFTYVGCGGGHTPEGSRVLDEFYYAHRAVEGETNHPYDDGFYMNFVHSFVGRFDFKDISPIEKEVERIISSNGWSVQVNHWITHKEQDIFHAQKADNFKEECEYLAKMSDKLWVCSFNDAVKYITEAKNSSLSVIEKDGCYTLRAENTLDSEIFDHPITIEIKTPAPVCVICENGEQTVAPKNGIAYLDIMPNTNVTLKRCS